MHVDTATGYSIVTQTLDANLSETALIATTPVQATGPTGQVAADSMSLTPDPKAEGMYLLVFNGRVKLVYQPK